MPIRKFYSVLGSIALIHGVPQTSSVPEDKFFLLAGVVGAALLLMAIGVVIMLRGRSKSEPHEAVAEAKPAPAWFKNLASTASKTLAHPDTPAAPQDAILVIRDPISTDWSVEVNGMRYASLKDIHDDKAAHKVLEALNGMQRFAGSIPITNTTPSNDSAAASLPPRETPPPAPPSAAIILPIQAGRSALPRHPAAPGSLLEQVEKILQRNLMKYPQLESSGIHIGATPQGGLQIEVGDNYYHAPDEVPDFTIRELIKTAIMEWERTA